MLQVVDDPSNKTKRDLGADEDYGMPITQGPVDAGLWRIPYFNSRCLQFVVHLPAIPITISNKLHMACTVVII